MIVKFWKGFCGYTSVGWARPRSSLDNSRGTFFCQVILVHFDEFFECILCEVERLILGVGEMHLLRKFCCGMVVGVTVR